MTSTKKAAKRKYRYGGDKPWRERIAILAVKQENGELWVQLGGTNAPRHILPIFCFVPEASIIVEETEDF